MTFKNKLETVDCKVKDTCFFTKHGNTDVCTHCERSEKEGTKSDDYYTKIQRDGY